MLTAVIYDVDLCVNPVMRWWRDRNTPELAMTIPAESFWRVGCTLLKLIRSRFFDGWIQGLISWALNVWMQVGNFGRVRHLLAMNPIAPPPLFTPPGRHPQQPFRSPPAFDGRRPPTFDRPELVSWESYRILFRCCVRNVHSVGCWSDWHRPIADKADRYCIVSLNCMLVV